MANRLGRQTTSTKSLVSAAIPIIVDVRLLGIAALNPTYKNQPA